MLKNLIIFTLRKDEIVSKIYHDKFLSFLCTINYLNLNYYYGSKQTYEAGFMGFLG